MEEGGRIQSLWPPEQEAGMGRGLWCRMTKEMANANTVCGILGLYAGFRTPSSRWISGVCNFLRLPATACVCVCVCDKERMRTCNRMHLSEESVQGSPQGLSPPCFPPQKLRITLTVRPVTSLAGSLCGRVSLLPSAPILHSPQQAQESLEKSQVLSRRAPAWDFQAFPFS